MQIKVITSQEVFQEQAMWATWLDGLANNKKAFGMAAAELIRDKIQTNDDTANIPPLSRDKGDKDAKGEVIDPGTPAQDTNVWVEGDSIFVGIPPSSNDKREEKAFQEGREDEDGGLTIEVTARVRSYMASKGFPLPKETKYLVFPAPLSGGLSEQDEEEVDDMVEALLDAGLEM